jgi:hypothetical protein
MRRSWDLFFPNVLPEYVKRPIGGVVGTRLWFDVIAKPPADQLLVGRRDKICRRGRNMMKFQILSLAAVATAALTAPVLAHHSFAMFDATKTITLVGTVKEFEWTNPHAWMRMTAVDGATGQPVEWSFEMGSPGQLGSRGMKPDSVKPGDKITLQAHPMKDGSRGGQYMSATLADGSILGNRAGAAPAAENP